MCARLREREINHQPRDELLKWSLVFRLLSLVMASAAFAIRCTGAEMLYFSFSQSRQQPVTRRRLFPGPAARAVCSMASRPLRRSQRPPRRDGPHPCVTAFQMSARVHTRAHTHPGQTHTDARMQAVVGRRRTTCGDVRMLRMNLCSTLALISFFRHMFLISKCKKKKKNEGSSCVQLLL